MPPVRQLILVGGHIREVEGGGGHEVGDDVDTDGGDGEGQHAEYGGGGVVDLVDDVDRVGDDVAVLVRADHRHRSRDGAHDEQREEQEVDRQTPPEVALLDLAETLSVAREVAEVEHRPGEVRDHQRERTDHHGERRPAGQALTHREIEAHVVPAGLRDQVAGEHDHHHVDRRAAEVDELADRVHTVPEHERLQDPHQEEAGPAERRETEESMLVDVTPTVRDPART